MAGQVEHSGGWRWEVTEGLEGTSLGLSGPTDPDHHWRQVLSPSSTFTTVPATVGLGLEQAVSALSDYRRPARRCHHDNETLHLIYNDDMSTLIGDPTTDDGGD